MKVDSNVSNTVSQESALRVIKSNKSNKYLVFTSAGDCHSVNSWLTKHRNFDVFVVYYGDKNFSEQSDVDFFLENKGGKFPNFHYVYHMYKELIHSYDAVMIIDDDIILSGIDISQLFELSTEKKLDLCQPSFSSKGKISHLVTKKVPFSLLRYSNFVEVTCPVFSTTSLSKFMDVYVPEIVCHGVDFWFSEVIGDRRDNIAIIDKFTCINPKDDVKGGIREIDRLQSDLQRELAWQKVKTEHNIKFDIDSIREHGFTVFTLLFKILNHVSKGKLR